LYKVKIFGAVVVVTLLMVFLILNSPSVKYTTVEEPPGENIKIYFSLLTSKGCSSSSINDLEFSPDKDVSWVSDGVYFEYMQYNLENSMISYPSLINEIKQCAKDNKIRLINGYIVEKKDKEENVLKFAHRGNIIWALTAYNNASQFDSFTKKYQKVYSVF